MKNALNVYTERSTTTYNIKLRSYSDKINGFMFTCNYNT